MRKLAMSPNWRVSTILDDRVAGSPRLLLSFRRLAGHYRGGTGLTLLDSGNASETA